MKLATPLPVSDKYKLFFGKLFLMEVILYQSVTRGHITLLKLIFIKLRICFLM